MKRVKSREQQFSPSSNGNKIAFWSPRALSVALVLGMTGACGQADLDTPSWTPGAPTADVTRVDGDGIVTNIPSYDFVPYETLYAALTQTLGVPYDDTDYDNGVDFEPLGPEDDPFHNPVLFLESRKTSLGAQDLSDPDPASNALGTLSGLGLKNWALAVTGAAGIAMDGPKQAEIFPAGVGQYETVYLVLLGRYPTSEEVTILGELSAEFATDADKAAAVVSALMLSLEFLTVN